ncbi:hypothetical protein YDYSY3_57380 [Paenibacillus chitinolyticus]|nr:hypothetical protein YDYSY3_57380 [Paenibacillus chitinolyticus]
MVFSKTVKHALVDKDINATELARLTGHSAQYMHNLLKGNRRWNEDTMNKVCKALKMELKLVPKEDADNTQ